MKNCNSLGVYTRFAVRELRKSSTVSCSRSLLLFGNTKKCNSLVFPLAFAVRKYEKVQQSRVPARFCCSEIRKSATVSCSRSFLLSSLQFVYFQETHALEKVAPAIKVIVWDCVFLALGSQRPFWEL